MKQFIIPVDGTVDTKATSTAPEQLHGAYDKDSFQLHFSETMPTTKAQLLAVKGLLEKAAGNKAPQRVKQRSKNIIAFALMDESDATKADTAKQAAYNTIVDEARKINNDLNAAQSTGGQQTPPPSGGQKTPPSGGGQQQKPAFDKTKDAFGRPLKQAYPGLFWPGMTPQEEEAACDEYWAMVRHVDKDIFHR